MRSSCSSPGRIAMGAGPPTKDSAAGAGWSFSTRRTCSATSWSITRIPSARPRLFTVWRYAEDTSPHGPIAPMMISCSARPGWPSAG